MEYDSFTMWFWKYVFSYLGTMFCGIALIILACRSGKVDINGVRFSRKRDEDEIEIDNDTENGKMSNDSRR